MNTIIASGANLGKLLTNIKRPDFRISLQSGLLSYLSPKASAQSFLNFSIPWSVKGWFNIW